MYSTLKTRCFFPEWAAVVCSLSNNVCGHSAHWIRGGFLNQKGISISCKYKASLVYNVATFIHLRGKSVNNSKYIFFRSVFYARFCQDLFLYRNVYFMNTVIDNWQIILGSCARPPPTLARRSGWFGCPTWAAIKCWPWWLYAWPRDLRVAYIQDIWWVEC